MFFRDREEEKRRKSFWKKAALGTLGIAGLAGGAYFLNKKGVFKNIGEKTKKLFNNLNNNNNQLSSNVDPVASANTQAIASGSTAPKDVKLPSPFETNNNNQFDPSKFKDSSSSGKKVPLVEEAPEFDLDSPTPTLKNNAGSVSKQPQGQSQPQGQPQPQGQSQPQGQPQPQGQSQPQGQPQPQGQSQPQGQPQPQGQSQPQEQPQKPKDESTSQILNSETEKIQPQTEVQSETSTVPKEVVESANKKAAANVTTQPNSSSVVQRIQTGLNKVGTTARSFWQSARQTLRNWWQAANQPIINKPVPKEVAAVQLALDKGEPIPSKLENLEPKQITAEVKTPQFPSVANTAEVSTPQKPEFNVAQQISSKSTQQPSFNLLGVNNLSPSAIIQNPLFPNTPLGVDNLAVNSLATPKVPTASSTPQLQIDTSSKPKLPVEPISITTEEAVTQGVKGVTKKTFRDMATIANLIEQGRPVNQNRLKWFMDQLNAIRNRLPTIGLSKSELTKLSNWLNNPAYSAA